MKRKAHLLKGNNRLISLSCLCEFSNLILFNLYHSLSKPEDVMRDLDTLILPHIQRDSGIEKIGFAGFCFGGYVGYLLSQQPGVLLCCAGIHSSIRIFYMHGSNESEATTKVTCPQMILQAGNDNPAGKPNSEVHEILLTKPFGGQCVLKEFEEMLHGWVLRGDLSNPAVERDVYLAMDMTMDFLTTHVK